MDGFFIKQALLGTDKTGKHSIQKEMESASPLLSDMFLKLDERDTEVSWKLLLAAGISSLADQAGYIPETTEIRPCDKFCPVDQRAEMPKALADTLFNLLLLSSAYNAPTSVEFHLLQRVAATSARLPDDEVPRFLQLFSRYVRYKSDTEFVPRLLGEKGRWLGSHNPAWQWCSGGALEENSLDGELITQWQEGTFEQRKQALTQLRSQNPDQGRELLEETWKSEKADHRDAFLQILKTEASDADIPFLEKAFTDRSSVVRNTAISILLCLPNSSLAHRSIHRANKILAGNVLTDYDENDSANNSVSAVGLSGFKLTPPNEYTKELKSDGIDEKPNVGFGQQGWWLIQLVARVPLAHWEEFFGRSPQQILELYRNDDFFSDLFRGWVNSLTQLGGSSEWFRVLWSCSQGKVEKSLEWGIYSIHNQLVLYGAQNATDQLKEILFSTQTPSTNQETWKTAWTALAEREPIPWSNDFAQRFGQYLINNSSAAQLIIKFLPIFPVSWHQRIFQIMTSSNDAEKNTFLCSKSDKEKILNELALCQKFNYLIETLQHTKSNQKG